MDVTSLGRVDPSDSRTFAKAYVQLLSPQPGTDKFNYVELDDLGIIYQHLLTMLKQNASTCEEALPVLDISLKFLWAILSRAPGVPWNNERNFKVYFSLVFGSARFVITELYCDAFRL